MSLYAFATLVPDPTFCLSLCLSPYPRCADKQPGAMAAEEVMCGIFSRILFAMLAGCLSKIDSEGGGSFCGAPAFHLCCDWMKSC